MGKYAAVVVLLVFFAISANSQTKAPLVNAAEVQKEVQKIAAEREAEHNASSMDPHQQLVRVQAAHLAAQRQTELKTETEKLLALATELKLHVDQTSNNVLSLDVIKKAAEIQKLAKSVQDKMKNAY